MHQAAAPKFLTPLYSVRHVLPVEALERHCRALRQREVAAGGDELGQQRRHKNLSTTGAAANARREVDVLAEEVALFLDGLAGVEADAYLTGGDGLGCGSVRLDEG